MEPYSRMHDIMLGYDTDLHFENGDLMTATGLDFIQREIFKVLVTDTGEWKLNQNIGGSPHRYVGQPNTREVADALQKHVQRNIAEVVYPAASTVRAVPTSVDKLMVFIDIFVLDEQLATLPFQFDFSGGLRTIQAFDPRVTPVNSSAHLKVNDSTNMQRPNKYWDRFRAQ